MRGKDCACFFFIRLLFELWIFSTVLLLVTQNIANTPLILKIISQFFLILFEHAKFICSFACTNFFLRPLLQIAVENLCSLLLLKGVKRLFA